MASALAQRVLQVALPMEGQAEVGENEGPIVQWSIGPWTHREPGPWAKWCAGFASTCLLEALATAQDDHQAEWEKIGSLSCDTLWARLTARGWTWRNSAGEPAEPGDLVFFGASTDLNHVGLVLALEGRTLRTIEGNAGDRVRRRSYDLSFPRLHGFARVPW